MSVDTHLRGKQTSGYRAVWQDGVKILLSPRLTAFASTVGLDHARRSVRRRFHVDIEHVHGPHCRH